MPALREGSHIRAIAPAGTFDPTQFDEGVWRLSSRYRVTYDEGVHDREGYLAGSDERRERELREALEDPDVDAIVAVRGGYGSMRIADRFDVETVRRAKKLLVGFSDVTALHALWQRAGLCSIHGAMIAALGRGDPALVERWSRAVEGAVPPPLTGLTTIAEGRVEGPLIGGNLALLAAMTGTPLAPPVDGAILFLEDVGEAPYRVDRMLTQLALAGTLERVAGVVLGRFTESKPGPDGTGVDEVLRERLSRLAKPVLSGLPAGHVDDNLELPLGATVTLDAGAGTVTFLRAAVATP